MTDILHLKEMPEGIVELGGSIEILPDKHMSAGVFPEPPDDIEVGGIRRQEYEFYIELPDLLLHGPAMPAAGTVTFTDYDGGSRFIFLFEAAIHLFVISDGEQCCMDNRDLIMIYIRRSPSFIGYGGISRFAQILYFLPINALTDASMMIFNMVPFPPPMES